VNRKTILVNDYQDTLIIKKLLDVGGKILENNEYYNELKIYKNSAYVNFKNFNNYGFEFIMKEEQ